MPYETDRPVVASRRRLTWKVCHSCGGLWLGFFFLFALLPNPFLGFQKPARIVRWLLLSFGAETLLRCGPRAACPRSSGFGWLGACRRVDGTIAAFKAPGGAHLLEGFAYLFLAA